MTLWIQYGEGKALVERGTVIQVLGLVTSMGLVSFAFNFWYSNIYNVPYINLEVGPVDTSFESVMASILKGNATWSTTVGNTGRQAATNVRVTILIQGMIQNWTYFTPEELRVAKASSNSLLFLVPRLAPGATLSVITSVVPSRENAGLQVWVTCDQGSAKVEYKPPKLTDILNFEYARIRYDIYITIGTTFLSSVPPIIMILRRVLQKKGER